jgi:CIC family chloride channel protein
MTGGAFGSMVAQMFRLTSAERKTLGCGCSRGHVSNICGADLVGAVGHRAFVVRAQTAQHYSRRIGQRDGGTTSAVRIGQGPLFPTVAHPSFISHGP